MMETLKSHVRMVSAVLICFNGFPKDMKAALFVGLLTGYLIFVLPSTTDKLLKREVMNSNVLITGASQGIGEELAYAFAKRGANLLLTARSENMLQRVGKSCVKLGANSVDYIAADMGKSEDIRSVYEYSSSRFHGRLDFLVLNHVKQNKADNWIGSPENMTALREIFEVNYFAYIQVASLFLPQLEDNSGRIVVVSSFVGKYPFPFFLPYVSSKFALEGFFGGLRHELKMKNSPVSVTSAVLGRIDTPGQRKAMGTGGFVRHGNVSAASAQKTAETILEGAVLRKKEVFYPVLIRPLVAVSNMPVLSHLLDWTVGFQMERFADA